MMNRQQLDQMWDHLRQVNGIALRCVAAIPADKIDARPIANMRTPKELVVHMYGSVVKAITESVLSGNLEDESHEARTCERIKTHGELLQYCRACWEAADKAVRSATDSHLQSTIKTAWGMDFPGSFMFGITHDELLHHRGQLYVYLRALGVEPPMLWDFEHNEPAYRPKAAARA